MGYYNSRATRRKSVTKDTYAEKRLYHGTMMTVLRHNIERMTPAARRWFDNQFGGDYWYTTSPSVYSIGNAYKNGAVLTDEQLKEVANAAVCNWDARFERNDIDAGDHFYRQLAEMPEVQMLNNWREATVEVFSTVVSVLANQSVGIGWTHHTPIACTDGEEVLLSSDWFTRHIFGAVLEKRYGSLPASWAELKGVLFHEMAHILYTPRANSAPTKAIWDAEHVPFQRYTQWQAYNMLEDQRIEGLLIGRYAPSVDFLRIIVLKHIASTGNDSWPLLAGRWYIDGKVRASAKAAWGLKAPLYVDEVEAIANEYRTLLFPADAQRAQELVARFCEIMNAVYGSHDDAPTTIDDHDDRMRSGRPESIGQQREDAEARDEAEERQAAESDSDDDGDDTAATDGEDGDDADGDSDGDSNDDIDSDGGMDANSDSPNKAGDPGTGNLVDAINDAINDAVQQTLEAGSEIAKAVSRCVQGAGSTTAPSHNDTIGLVQMPVEDWMHRGAQRIAQTFATIYADAEAEWHRGQSNGRLNVASVMESRGRHFDVFDQYDEGTEDTLSFEIVLLVDRSSSMGSCHGGVARGECRGAAQSAWMIRRACQQFGIPVTVLGYDDIGSMLCTSNTIANSQTYPLHQPRGGTDATESIRWAAQILKNSTATHRLVFTITDGTWVWQGDSDPVNLTLKDIHAAGGKSLIVHIGGGSSDWYQPYGHQEMMVIANDDVANLYREFGRRIARLGLRDNNSLV